MFLNQTKYSEPRVDANITGYLESELYIPAYEHKRHWMEKFFVYRQMFNGDMWGNIEAPKDFFGVLNITETTVISILSEILALDRTIKLTSYTLEGVYRADKMQTFLKQEMDASFFAQAYKKMQFEKVLVGGGFYKVSYDEDKLAKVDPDFSVGGSDQLPIGRLGVKFIRPELIFPEPDRGELSECGYVIEVEKTRLSDIIRTYDPPEKLVRELVKRVGKGTSNGNIYREIEKEIRSNNHYTGFGRYIKSLEPYSRFNREVWLMRAYIRDDAVMEYDIAVHDNAGAHIANVVMDKKKYPGGRIITWVDDIILEDVSNPWDFATAVGYNYPFIYEKFLDDADSRVFWGKGKVESMLGVNIDINFIYSQLISQIGHMGNPKWLVERGAVHDIDSLNNDIGGVVETFPGAVSQGKISRKQGLPPEQGTLNFVGWLVEMFEKQTGRTEVTQGVNPKGVNTFRGIVSLMDSANKKLLPIFLNLDLAMSTLGKMILCIIADFYQGIPRVMSMEDKKLNPPIREFSIRAIQADKYSYNVRVGSLATKTKDMSQIEMLSFLAQTGMVDVQTILELLDIENVSEIIDRMREAQQLAEEEKRKTLIAQSQAQQQQAMAVESQRGRNAIAEQLVKGGLGGGQENAQ